jgi:hypothetical protein
MSTITIRPQSKGSAQNHINTQIGIFLFAPGESSQT